MYYLRTRYYDPKIARFISEDTFPGWYTDPLSLNKYTYTHNNPVSYHDPNGTSIFGDIWGGIKKGVSSATKWVSNNIVKPIKEIFTPKKESSPASVGQNAATNNKYTPTSSGGKKNYSSGSSGGSSSTVSKEPTFLEKVGDAISKGFESIENWWNAGSGSVEGKKTEDELALFGLTNTSNALVTPKDTRFGMIGIAKANVYAGTTVQKGEKGIFNVDTYATVSSDKSVESGVTVSIGSVNLTGFYGTNGIGFNVGINARYNGMETETGIGSTFTKEGVMASLYSTSSNDKKIGGNSLNFGITWMSLVTILSLGTITVAGTNPGQVPAIA